MFESVVERLLNRLSHRLIRGQIDTVAGVGPQYVGDVPVARLCFAHRQPPFHQPAIVANFRLIEVGQRAFDLEDQRLIRLTEHFGCFQVVAKTLAHQILIEGVARREGRSLFLPFASEYSKLFSGEQEGREPRSSLRSARSVRSESHRRRWPQAGRCRPGSRHPMQL
jgi:hypothetical protein